MSTNKSGNNGNHGGGNQGVPGNGQQGGRNGGNLGTSHSTTQGGQHQGQHGQQVQQGQQAQQGGRGVAGKDAEVEDLASKDLEAADEQTQAPDSEEPRDDDKGSRPPPAPGARRSVR